MFPRLKTHPSGLLLVTALLITAAIVLASAVSEADRTAGLVSVALTVIAAFLIQLARARAFIAGGVVLVGVPVALFATMLIAPETFQGPFAAMLRSNFPHVSAIKTLGIEVNRNSVAAAAMLLPVIALVLASQQDIRLRYRIFWGAVAVVATMPVVGPGSRSGALGLIVAIGVLGTTFINSRHASSLALLGSISLGVLIALLTGTDLSMNERQEIWQTSAQIIADDPLTGLGFGGLAHLSALASGAHNTILQTWTDLGATGLLVTVAPVVFIGGHALGDIRAHDSDRRVGARITICGIAALAILGTTESVVTTPLALAIDITTPTAVATDIVTFVSPILYLVLAASARLFELRP